MFNLRSKFNQSISYVICTFLLLLTVFCTIGQAGRCSTDLDYLLSDDFYEEDAVKGCADDPFESFNRVMFTFNDKLYIFVVEPVTTFYSNIVPGDLRRSVEYFFSNLSAPIRLVNSLLQGRFSDGYTVLQRFLINSTIGVYGLTDLAANDFDLQPVNAHLGQTLGSWGVDYGFYLYIPFYGPSTIRDFAGTLIDSLYMIPYYTWIDDWYVKAGIYAGQEMNELSFHFQEYDDLKSLTLDPYIAVRNGYFQYHQARNNAKYNADQLLFENGESNEIK